jgi:hypothetical protein
MLLCTRKCIDAIQLDITCITIQLDRVHEIKTQKTSIIASPSRSIGWKLLPTTEPRPSQPTIHHHPLRPATTPLRPKGGPSSVSAPHDWTRHCVGLRVVPLVKGNAWVGRLVHTRDLDSRSRSAGARRLDLELVAFDVEPGDVSGCLAGLYWLSLTAPCRHGPRAARCALRVRDIHRRGYLLTSTNS